MAKFQKNYARNISTRLIDFQSICDLHLQVFYKKNVHPYFELKIADKIISKIRKLIIICQQNFNHIAKLKNCYYGKDSNTISYALDNIFWLKSKYKNTMQYYKLETSFFRLIQLLYLVLKQLYRLKLCKKC